MYGNPLPTWPMGLVRGIRENHFARSDYVAVAYCNTGSDESTWPKLMIRNR
jgi:hypothetical protein